LRLSALVLSSLFFGACASSPHGAGPTDQAPDFQVTDQSGRVWTLADAQAKPILVDLWATWCAPCLQALPDLERFAQTHGQRMTVLGLATDQQGWPVVAPVVKRYGLSYPVAVVGGDLSKAFGAPAYPYLVLVHKGAVLKRLKGRHTYLDLEKELAPWLN
jgi:thiol-disulfide isomerase/thioredoxin